MMTPNMYTTLCRRLDKLLQVSMAHLQATHLKTKLQSVVA